MLAATQACSWPSLQRSDRTGDGQGPAELRRGAPLTEMALLRRALCSQNSRGQVADGNAKKVDSPSSCGSRSLSRAGSCRTAAPSSALLDRSTQIAAVFTDAAIRLHDKLLDQERTRSCLRAITAAGAVADPVLAGAVRLIVASAESASSVEGTLTAKDAIPCVTGSIAMCNRNGVSSQLAEQAAAAWDITTTARGLANGEAGRGG